MKTPLLMTMALAAGTFLASPGVAQDKKAADANVTVTGCLAQGEKSNQFTLKDTSGKSYSLRAGPGVDLKAHVGHKVNLIATPMHPGKKVKAGSPEETLHVDNLSMVSNSCS